MITDRSFLVVLIAAATGVVLGRGAGAVIRPPGAALAAVPVGALAPSDHLGSKASEAQSAAASAGRDESEPEEPRPDATGENPYEEPPAARTHSAPAADSAARRHAAAAGGSLRHGLRERARAGQRAPGSSGHRRAVLDRPDRGHRRCLSRLRRGCGVRRSRRARARPARTTRTIRICPSRACTGATPTRTADGSASACRRSASGNTRRADLSRSRSRGGGARTASMP